MFFLREINKQKYAQKTSAKSHRPVNTLMINVPIMQKPVS